MISLCSVFHCYWLRNSSFIISAKGTEDNSFSFSPVLGMFPKILACEFAKNYG